MAWREEAAFGNVEILGKLKQEITAYAADTALGGDFPTSLVTLGTGVDITTWTPTVGVIYTIVCLDSTADATLQPAGGIDFLDGTDTVTFGASGDTLVCQAVSATQIAVLSISTATVTFA